MNENPEGTPNPFSSNPEVGNTPDLPLEPNQMDELAPEPQPEVEVVETETTIETVTVPETTVETVAAPEATSEAATAPEATMETAAAPEATVEATAAPKKSKKTAWIVVAIVAVLVAIGCAVAAILLLNPLKSEDKIQTAITKLLNGETPKNVAASGTLVLEDYAEDATVETVKFDFEMEAATAYGTSKLAATATITTVDGMTFAVDTEGVRVASGDIYVKVGGILDAITEMVYEQLDCEPMVDCPEFEAGDFSDFGILAIDDQWMRIPAEFMDGMMDSFLEGDEIQCVVEAFAQTNTGDLKEIYENNPFIASTTENLKLVAKKGELYRLLVDEEKLEGFKEAAKNSELATALKRCGGSEAEGTELFASSPIVYAELDQDGNFARLYLDATLEEQSVTLDMTLSYPSTIEIVEPADYIEIENVLTSLFLQMGGGFEDFDGELNAI